MKTKAILPCAGYGTRMGMAPNTSKELISDPFHNNAPIIEYTLNLCSLYNIEPLVVTRQDKTDLIEYCNINEIETLIIEPQGEWPTTMLKSQPHWAENNILLLPDVRFEPWNTIRNMKRNLELGNKAVFALHKVDDVSKWGQIKNYKVIEKPHDNSSGFAWGVMGFKADYGEQLFSMMGLRNNPYTLQDTSFLYLTNFKDITRTGSIENVEF